MKACQWYFFSTLEYLSLETSIRTIFVLKSSFNTAFSLMINENLLVWLIFSDSGKLTVNFHSFVGFNCTIFNHTNKSQCRKTRRLYFFTKICSKFNHFQKIMARRRQNFVSNSWLNLNFVFKNSEFKFDEKITEYN